MIDRIPYFIQPRRSGFVELRNNTEPASAIYSWTCGKVLTAERIVMLQRARHLCKPTRLFYPGRLDHGVLGSRQRRRDNNWK
jgi:hypothetical protein